MRLELRRQQQTYLCRIQHTFMVHGMPTDVHAHLRGWLNVSQFAELAALHRQSAWEALRQCERGRLWRGHQLRVVVVEQLGLKGRRQYRVDPVSLPTELRTLLVQEHEGEVPGLLAPLSTTTSLASWRLSVVQSIQRETESGTSQRADLIRKVAARTLWPEGRRQGEPIGERTLHRWIEQYGDDGYGGLLRQPRTDRGKRRVIISRRWDATAAAAGLDTIDQRRIAAELYRYIKSTFRSSGSSIEDAARDASAKLAELSEPAMPGLDRPTLLERCAVPQELAGRYRVFRAVHTRRKDAGRSAAKQEPRIKRDRSHLLPMDSIVGDVTHLDIWMGRQDGNGEVSQATAKLVAFYDKATNRAFFRAFLMPKGRMIGRAEVLQTVAAMLADEAWGAPGNLYLDNGSEFQWDEIAAEIHQLRQGINIHLNEGNTPGAVTRAKVGNAPAKGSIEGFFGNFTRNYLSKLKGYIGGDRMRSKKEHQGRPPALYPGNIDELSDDLGRLINLYHAQPQQKGHIAGRSPNQAFAHFVEQGWRAMIVDEDKLEFVFSRRETRKVQAGGFFSVDGVLYQHDKLIILADSDPKVLLRIPFIKNRTRIFVCDPRSERPLCIAEPMPAFADGDNAGSAAQGRMSGILNAEIRQMERETDLLDPMDGVDRQLAYLPSSPIPNTPDRAYVSLAGYEAAEQSKSLPSRERGQSKTLAEVREEQEYDNLLARFNEHAARLDERERRTGTG